MYDLAECSARVPNSQIERFDFRFWTVECNRSAMASIKERPYNPPLTSRQSLLIQTRFTSNADIIKTLWSSEDKHGHAASRYETKTGYSGEVLDMYLGTATPERPYYYWYRYFFEIKYTNGQVFNVECKRYTTIRQTNYRVRVTMPFDDMYAYTSPTKLSKISPNGIESISLVHIPEESGLGKEAVIRSYNTNSAGRCVSMDFEECYIPFTAGDTLFYRGVTDTIKRDASASPSGLVTVYFDTSNPNGFYPDESWEGVKPVLTPVKPTAIDTEENVVAIGFDGDYPVHSSLFRWIPNTGGFDPDSIALRMAGNFDDMRNVTPSRLIEECWALGYTGTYTLSIGSSYYQETTGENDGGGNFYNAIDDANARKINLPTQRWLEDLAEQLEIRGFSDLILSVPLKIAADYALQSGHPSDAWVQRDTNGVPYSDGEALPSTAITPASSAAVGYLGDVLEEGVGYCIGAAPSITVTPQVRAPLWQYNASTDNFICIYDATTTTRYNTETGQTPATPHLEAVENITQTEIDANQDYLDWLRDRLGDAVQEILAPTLTEYPTLEKTVLLTTPPIVAPEYPVEPVLNYPQAKYAFPAFDFIGIEDYDFVTDARWSDVAASFALIDTLGYTKSTSAYYSGFIADSADRWKWWRVDYAIDEANAENIGIKFVSAHTEADRDGFFWYEYGNTQQNGFFCGGGACSL